ncbi:DUF2530 domain-containing protein [Blastococcus sp. PRF04-17]|nr:DUF2530 domain-containing protein [Blastococcus sp. PRF04-17]
MALVVLLVLGDRVDRMWTWTCVAAIGLGFLGLWIMKLQGQLKDPSPAARTLATGPCGGADPATTRGRRTRRCRTARSGPPRSAR